MSKTDQPQGAYRTSLRRCIPGKEAEYGEVFKRFCDAQIKGDAEEEARVKVELRALQFVVSEENFPNIVTGPGRNFILDTVLRETAYTAACYLGLKGVGTAVSGDTQSSHASWVEQGLANAPVYTGNRKTITFNAASAQSITHAAVTFAFTSGGTIAGCFMNLAGSATKDTTTGTLLSAGDFTGGNKTVASSDTLDVTYTLNG